MPPRDSTYDAAALGRARALLKPPLRRAGPMPAIATAAFFAFAGMALAVVTITSPTVMHGDQKPLRGVVDGPD